MLGKSIVALPTSYAAGHARLQFSHGAGREFHGFEMSFGGLNTSLVAEKAFLEEEFHLITLWIRTAELNHYMDVMRSVQKDSSFFAGTAFRSFQALAVNKSFNSHDHFSVGLTAVILMLSILTYAFNFVGVFVSGNVKIAASISRLLGPLSINDSGIDSVIKFKHHAFALYTIGMLMFFATAMANSLKMKPLYMAFPPLITVFLVAVAFVYYMWDIRRRFDLPENKLTTGKVFFYHSGEKDEPAVTTEVLPESPKNAEKKSAIQSFCTDCGNPYKSAKQQFCEVCGGESEWLTRSKKRGLEGVAEEEEKVEEAPKPKTGNGKAKKGNAKNASEAEMASLV